MNVVFDDFQLLSESGFFDAQFYLRQNPDIVGLNVDPLMHYLEWGGRERRDPSATFDTLHYLRQCAELGESPENPLVHYLTIGVKRGLTPKQSDLASSSRSVAEREPAALNQSARRGEKSLNLATANLLFVDVPTIVNGRAIAPIKSGGLSVIGWALADAGVQAIEVALDSQRVIGARHGLRRPDVAAVYAGREGALLSGYAAHVPPKALPIGEHRVTVTLHDRDGRQSQLQFRIDVEQHESGSGPWQLRRRMPYSEVLLKRLLLRQKASCFHFIMPAPLGNHARERTRDTLRTLARQAHDAWRVTLVARTSDSRGSYQRLRTNLLAHMTEISERLHIIAADTCPAVTEPRSRTFAWSLAPGDELSCDAVLEMALAAARDSDAELLYCDDRRCPSAHAPSEAFFKPGWSPDLLLSMNYLGRAWCADTRLLEKAHLSWSDLTRMSSYDSSLRLTEVACNIRHVPKVLLGHEPAVDNEAAERRALADALKRRKVSAEVTPGLIPGRFRVRRRSSSERVSIIIPTCAANERVRTCLETLRATTSYPNYEIICIENIPRERSHMRRWLKAQADTVITASEPFNWSGFCNRAARRAAGAHLLFLNDDVEIVDTDWLATLVEQSQRPEVGTVGALLLYPDLSVQHAGMNLDDRGAGRHSFRHLPQGEGGYFGLALTQRNVIGVTGACLLTRRETFSGLGGFDEAHSIVNNDLDYCLRVWSAGLLNVYTPHARLIHHELASRGELPDRYDVKKFEHRWREVTIAGDPYSNPNLCRQNEMYVPEWEPTERIYTGHPVYDRSAIHRILAIKLDHIGDCVTALPAVRRLKQKFPHAQITVLCARATSTIWRAEPCVQEVVEFDLYHARSGLGKMDVALAAEHELQRELRKRNFDLAIDLRKQPDSRHVLRLSGALLLAGFDHNGRFPWLDLALEWDEDVPLRVKRTHISDDLIALVETVAAHGDSEREPVLGAPVAKLPLPREAERILSTAYVCLHPAAGTPMRQWPLENFAELIDLLRSKHRIVVTIVGSESDESEADALMRLVGKDKGVLNLTGKLNVAELHVLLARATLFIGNNSGPQHIAAALGTPTIGIHSGVVDAREWGPVGRNAVAIRRDMSCSPCFLERTKDCLRALECLRALTAMDVYRACADSLTDITGSRCKSD